MLSAFFSLCRRFARTALLPLIGAAVVLHTSLVVTRPPDDLPSWVGWAPLTLGITAVALALRLGRGPAVVAGLVLILAHRGLQLAEPAVPGSTLTAAQLLIVTLLPVNLLAVALMRPRGMLSNRGVLPLSLLALEVTLVIFVLRMAPPGWQGALSAPAPWGGSPLPLAAQGLTAVSILLAAVLPLRLGSPTERTTQAAMVGALLAGALASHWAAGDRSLLGASVYFSAAHVILIIAMIETLYSHAYLDALTGLPGRRALSEFTAGLSGDYAIGMIDVDHFKKFNDTYGHDTGDEVLRMVASHLGSVSGGGSAYRYGGEEFTVVFPGKTVEEALPHLEQLRASIAEAAFVVRDAKRPKASSRRKMDKAVAKRSSGSRSRQGKRITVSIGVAGRSDRSEPAAEVIERADKALYKAKKAGRNRVAR